MAFEPVPFGKYTLYEKLAVGGMAIIYRARIQGVKGFQKDLVIKQILPQYSGMNDFIDMFIDEAKIAVNLNHANIVPVYELGEIENQLYIAMEFVAGRDLQQILEACEEKKVVVDPRIAAYILIGVCRGLDYAHNKKDDTTRQPLNIIHRDISPNNVIVSYEGEVKIIDFGIAKASIKVSVTQFGTLKGKMIYMSPEQAAEQKLDHRSDVFSAGILLYELVTGKKPYGGDNFAVTQENVKKASFPPPNVANAGLPPAMNQIILKAMARDSNERFASAFDFERALSDFLFSTGQNVYARDVAQFIQDLFHGGEGAAITGTATPGEPSKIPTIPNLRNLSTDGGTPKPGPASSSFTPTHDIPAAPASVTPASRSAPIPEDAPQKEGSIALSDLPDEGPAIEDDGPSQTARSAIAGDAFDFEIPPPPAGAAPVQKESQKDTVVTRLPSRRTPVPDRPGEGPTPPPSRVPGAPSEAATPPPVTGRDGVVPAVARANDSTRTNPSGSRSWVDLPQPPALEPRVAPGVVPAVESDEETAPGAPSREPARPINTPRPLPPPAAPTRPRLSAPPAPTGNETTPPRGTPLPPRAPQPPARPTPPPSALNSPPRGTPAPVIAAPWETGPEKEPSRGFLGAIKSAIGTKKDKAPPAPSSSDLLEGFYDSPHDFLTNSYATYGDRRGLFLTTQQLDAKLGVDIPLDIQFRAPPANFRVHGRVIWRRAKEGTSKGKRLPAGLAIEFVDGIDDDLEALFAYLGLP